jgi:hypothetical protein
MSSVASSPPALRMFARRESVPSPGRLQRARMLLSDRPGAAAEQSRLHVLSCSVYPHPLEFFDHSTQDRVRADPDEVSLRERVKAREPRGQALMLPSGPPATSDGSLKDVDETWRAQRGVESDVTAASDFHRRVGAAAPDQHRSSRCGKRPRCSSPGTGASRSSGNRSRSRSGRFQVHDQIDTRRETRKALEHGRHPADDDVASAGGFERREQRFEQHSDSLAVPGPRSGGLVLGGRRRSESGSRIVPTPSESWRRRSELAEPSRQRTWTICTPSYPELRMA